MIIWYQTVTVRPKNHSFEMTAYALLAVPANCWCAPHIEEAFNKLPLSDVPRLPPNDQVRYRVSCQIDQIATKCIAELVFIVLSCLNAPWYVVSHFWDGKQIEP